MALDKQYYDHRCVKCPGCAHHRPEGKRPESISPNEIWPEACGLYGYSFHPDRYPEDADDCEGFETPTHYRMRMELQEARKKKKQQ